MLKQLHGNYITKEIGLKQTAQADIGTFSSVYSNNNITSDISVTVENNVASYFNFNPKILKTRSGALLLKFPYIDGTFNLDLTLELAYKDTLFNTLFISLQNLMGSWKESYCNISNINTDFPNSCTKILQLGETYNENNEIIEHCIKIGDISDFTLDDITVLIKTCNLTLEATTLTEGDDYDKWYNSLVGLDFDISLLTELDNHIFESWTKEFGVHKIVDGEINIYDKLYSYANSKYTSIDVKGNKMTSLATKWDAENLDEFKLMGPDESVDNNIVAFDGDNNDLIKDSGRNLDEYVDVINVLTLDNTTPYEPTEDYHPATNKYVQDNLPVISGDLFFTAPIEGTIPANSERIIEILDVMNNTAYVWEYFMSDGKNKFELNTINALIKDLESARDVKFLYQLDISYLAEDLNISRDGQYIGFGYGGGFKNAGDTQTMAKYDFFEKDLNTDSNHTSYLGRISCADNGVRLIGTAMYRSDYSKGLHVIQDADISNDGLRAVVMQGRLADETETTGSFSVMSRANTSSAFVEEDFNDDAVFRCTISGDGLQYAYTFNKITTYQYTTTHADPGSPGSPSVPALPDSWFYQAVCWDYPWITRPSQVTPLPTHIYFVYVVPGSYTPEVSKFWSVSSHGSNWMKVSLQGSPGTPPSPSSTYEIVHTGVDMKQCLWINGIEVDIPGLSKADKINMDETGEKVFVNNISNNTSYVYGKYGNLIQSFSNAGHGSMSNDGKLIIVSNTSTNKYDIYAYQTNRYVLSESVDTGFSNIDVILADTGIFAFANGLVYKIPVIYTINEEGLTNLMVDKLLYINKLTDKLELKIKNLEPRDLKFKAKRIIQ